MTGVYQIKKKQNFFSGLSVNVSLIIANVVAFVVFTILISSNANFINFIAIKPSNIVHGQYLWTIITSMFMHGGIFHLFANMLTLFFMGSLIEKILGRKRYLWFYIAAGIFASLLFVLLSFVFPVDYNQFAVGASGAIFGLIGLLMVLTPNLPVMIFFIPIPIKLKYAAPGILIVLWLISVAGSVPIGNTAHLGGFIFGLLYGWYLRNKYKRKTQYIRKYFS